jgi:hypothetical protein
MTEIKVRWGDLGSPAEPGTYRYGPHKVEVTPSDIKLANGNPDSVFTAIHPRLLFRRDAVSHHRRRIARSQVNPGAPWALPPPPMM